MKNISYSHRKNQSRDLPSNRRRAVTCLLIFLALAFTSRAQTPSEPSSKDPTQDYLVYVVCESADKIVLIRFGPGGAQH